MSNHLRLLAHQLQGGDLFAEGIGTTGGAKYLAYLLFMAIRERHGDAWARMIFVSQGRPPSKRLLGQIKNFALLDRLDMMKPGPNVARLAKQLAKESENLPRAERITPRGSTDVATIDHHLRALVRKRKAGVANGTWHGPMSVQGTHL